MFTALILELLKLTFVVQASTVLVTVAVRQARASPGASTVSIRL